jgi:hypothetical protein
MGKISQYTCKCGYKGKFYLGGGMHLPDVTYINNNFPTDKLGEFNTAAQTGKLGPIFYFEKFLAYCNTCKELKEIKQLHYEVDGIRKSESDYCDKCNNEVTRIEEDPCCPKCGKKLSGKEVGLWD